MSKCVIVNCIDCKLHSFSHSRQLKNSYCQYNWEKISPTYSSTERTKKRSSNTLFEKYEKSFFIDFDKAVLNIPSDPKRNTIYNSSVLKYCQFFCIKYVVNTTLPL